MRLIAAAVLALAAAPALAEPCYKREHLVAFLRHEHQLPLRSWGLDDAGQMLELFERSDGHFAVVITTPDQCSTLIFPHKERGRLSERTMGDRPDDESVGPTERCIMIPGGQACAVVRPPLFEGRPT